MSVAYLFWKLSSYTMYIVCTTCPSSRSDADLFENCKVVYRSRCHITYSPDSILLSIAFGTENPILYCCNYILLGGYYTYWSYYMCWLIFFLIESIISTGRSQKKINRTGFFDLDVTIPNFLL